MKSIIRVLIIFSSVIFLSACNKVVVVPGQYPVNGSWVLTDAAQSNGYGWQHFYTGLENGVFNFYNNGVASYDNGQNLLNGSWNITTVVSGYYDQYGNYYNDSHQSFEVHVYDSYSNSSVDLYFDDVVFTGNQIIATNYNGTYIERYIFGRY